MSAKAAAAMGAQDQKATNDALATAAGAVLFWPALFLIKGDAGSAQQIAELKGYMEALEEANTKKKCGIQLDKGQANPS